MATQTKHSQISHRNVNLREIAIYFLKLGVTGFGGPLAVVGQMEQDLGGQWISKEDFAKVFAAIKTLPGPVAFQTAVFLGGVHGRKVGAPILGASLAAIGFVLPSMFLMLLLASTRAIWAEWSWTSSALVGFQAAGLGLVTASVIPLLKNITLTEDGLSAKSQSIMKWIFVLFSFITTMLQPSLEPVAIILCGLLALRPNRSRFFSTTLVLTPATLVGLSKLDINWTLFFTALKAGGLTFGTGLAIVPLLGGEFVDKLQWLTQSEFLEALAFGQITPGPVVITATYVGTKVAGINGGLIATVGIFLLPFIHMTTWFPRFWIRVNGSHQWRRFSFGALAAVVGALVASTLKLLEPVLLAALEVEKFEISKSVVTLLLWITIPVATFCILREKKQPAWAVLICAGIISALSLFFVR